MPREPKFNRKGKNINNYQVQITGENFIAQTLVEKGYVATIVRGKAPETDILARVPNGRSFSVEVKSLRKPNFWLFREPTCNTDFWFFVITDAEPKLVSIMTGKEVKEAWNDYFEHYCKMHNETCDRAGDGWGINQGVVKQHINRWDKLPRINEH